jgi:uncharacterized protein YicC (UPF0701 family)
MEYQFMDAKKVLLEKAV